MKRSLTERTILRAYNGIADELWTGQTSPLYREAVRNLSKFMSCGKLLSARNGHNVYHWCRRPCCPTCANYWGRTLAQSLLKAYPATPKTEFRALTVVWGLVPDPEAAFA